MSEAIHTPGPWTVAVHDNHTTIESRHWTVAFQVGNIDAALIAAAPDMLAALQTASDFLSDQVDVNWAGDGPNRAMRVKAEVDAAIERVEGRS